MRQILPIVVAALLLAACVDIEEHKLYMVRVNDQWLISDFDGHKKECIRYLANKRKNYLKAAFDRGDAIVAISTD